MLLTAPFLLVLETTMQARFQSLGLLQLHRRVAFLLPHVPAVLKSPRPKAYPEVPKTLGEHMFKRRSELGLTRPQASLRLLVSPDTLLLWEHDRATPTVRYYPAILRFLGYDPFPRPTTLAERIVRHRQRLGLSIEAAAKLLGVDEGTFGAWERGTRRPTHRGKVVERFFAIPPVKETESVPETRRNDCG